MGAEVQSPLEEEEVSAGRPGGRGWIGLALIALRRCGMAGEQIRAILGAGDDEIVRRIWSCVRRGDGRLRGGTELR
jgi:hypothetical protein